MFSTAQEYLTGKKVHWVFKIDTLIGHVVSIFHSDYTMYSKLEYQQNNIKMIEVCSVL